MKRLNKLNWEERQLAIAQGFLTGNIFDWGASEAVRFFTQSQDTVDGMASFDKALAKLQVCKLIHISLVIPVISGITSCSQDV